MVASVALLAARIARADANTEKLDAELKAAGVPIAGCASDGRVDYLSSATAAQRAQGAAILAAHDPALTQAQKLRGVGLRQVLAALVLKSSPATFAALTLTQQAAVQAVIDAAATSLASKLP